MEGVQPLSARPWEMRGRDRNTSPSPHVQPPARALQLLNLTGSPLLWMHRKPPAKQAIVQDRAVMVEGWIWDTGKGPANSYCNITVVTGGGEKSVVISVSVLKFQ